MFRFLVISSISVALIGCNNDTVVSDTHLIAHRPLIESVEPLKLVGSKQTKVQLNASDVDGDSLEFSLIDAPAWVKIDQSGQLVCLPRLEDVGQYQFVVRVSDGQLFSDTKIFADVSIPMTPIEPGLVNHAPILEAINSVTLVGSKATSIQLKVYDQDNDPLTYAIKNAPKWAKISQTGVLTMTPTREDAGHYLLNVEVSDGTLSATKQIQLNVVIPMTPIEPGLVNHAPTMDAIKSVTLVGSKTMSIQLKAYDQDNDPLTYAIKNAPKWAKISQTGVLTMTPTREDAGHYLLNAEVSDGTLSATKQIQLNVVVPMTPIEPGLVNHAPEIQPVGALSLKDEVATSFQVLATDPDNDTLSFQLIAAPDWVKISPDGLVQLNPTREDAGSFSFVVRVSDGAMSTDTRITGSVTLVNRAPIIEQISHQNVNDLEATSFQIKASDDQTTVIRFSLVNAPLWANITPTGYLTLAPNRDDEGEYTLTVRGSDGELYGETEFTVSVIASNVAPVISEIILPEAIVGEDYRYQIIATDADEDTLVYTLTNEPSWMSLNPKTGLITGTAREESYGETDFSVRVTDGKLSAHTTVQLKTVGKTETQTYSEQYAYDFDLQMKLPQLDVRAASISEERLLKKENSVTFTDIQFVSDEENWYLVNNTMLPIDDLTVSVSKEENPILLVFSKTVMPYTKVKLDLGTQDYSTLQYFNVKTMYLPTMSLAGDNSCDSAPDNKTCYDSPESGTERQTNERTLAFIYDSFNRPSFIENVQTFFKDRCEQFAPCIDYTQDNPQNLDYGYRNYLTLGQEGHRLSMLVMRKVYAAEGMGGGVSPSLSTIRDWNGHGWASIWAEYLDSNSEAYRPLPMNTLFHEIAHANGYGHDSGWTYGFSENFEWTYLPTTGQDLTQTPILRMPTIIPKMTITPYNIEIEIFSKEGVNHQSNIHFKVASSSQIDFKTSYENISSKNVLNINFSELPNAPVYVHVWDDNSVYMATLKVDKFMLAKSLNYEFDGIKYKVIDPRIVPDDANGWSVKDVCRRPQSTSRVATKAEYQRLYDYMFENGIIEDLDELNQDGQSPLRSFVSDDEPQPYYIWNVYFEEQKMNYWYFVMTGQMESSRSVVCVQSSE